MKWPIRSGLAFVALVAVALFLRIPAERIARLAADRLEAATGHALNVDRPVEATLWPHPGIAPGAFFGGDIHIRKLEVTGARLALERRADGTANREMETAPTAEEVRIGEENGKVLAGGGPELLVDRAILTGAEIRWTDAVTGTELHLRAVDVAPRLGGLDALVAVTASALVKGRALSLEASAEALRLLPDGAPTPVALSLAAAGRRSGSWDGPIPIRLP